MLKSKDPKQAEEWRKKIDDWRQSGKSMAEWCRERQLKIHQFYYWKDRWDRKRRQSPGVPAGFCELHDCPSATNQITLGFAGVTIRLETNFNEATLLRCLNVIRRSECSQ